MGRRRRVLHQMDLSPQALEGPAQAGITIGSRPLRQRVEVRLPHVLPGPAREPLAGVLASQNGRLADSGPQPGLRPVSRERIVEMVEEPGLPVLAFGALP